MYVRVHVHRHEERKPTRYKVVVGEHNRDKKEVTQVTHDVELVYERQRSRAAEDEGTYSIQPSGSSPLPRGNTRRR